MCTMSSGAVILALAALLGPLAIDAAAACTEYQPTPKITINGDTRDPDTGKNVRSYGERIIINCFSLNTNLTMKKDGVPQDITILNGTTIQLYEENPKIGIHTYSCSDSENKCEASLSVSVKPAMFLKSTMVQHKFDQVNRIHVYFVPIGGYYDVLCNGNNVEALRILLNNNNRIYLRTNIVNDTTLIYTKKAKEQVDKAYFCKSKGEELHEMIVVSTGYFPDALNFECVIYYTQELKCSWLYASSGNSYKLYYTDHNLADFTILLRTDHFSKQTNICKVNENFMSLRLFHTNHNVSFTLTTCNQFVCNNQTFSRNTDAITQQSPLQAVYVLHASHCSAVLVWEKSRPKSVYKVQYRLRDFKDRWRQANSSSARCHEKCELEMGLPYPDVQYLVTVQSRNEKANDDLWSQPIVTFVTTKPKPECICDALQSPAFSIVSCQLCMNSEDLIKKSLTLKYKIKSLREKLHKVDELLDLQWKSKQINDRIKHLG